MQRVLLDSTDTITSYPRIAVDGVISSGLPTGATALRVGPGNKDTSYQSATVDSFSQTAQGTQAIGSDSITLAGAATIVAGRKYLVTDAQHGRTMIVQATNSGSSSTMYLQEPLLEHISSGSTIKGIACTIALTSTLTNSVGQGFVYFRATVDGVVREWDEAFRVVRRITGIELTPSELTQVYPVVRQIASNTDLTLEEAISASWKHVIVPLLSAKQVLDEDVLTDDVLCPLHAAATVLHLARQWPSANSEFVDRMEANFERIKQTTFDRIDLLTASQEEDAPQPTPGSQTPATMRFVR